MARIIDLRSAHHWQTVIIWTHREVLKRRSFPLSQRWWYFGRIQWHTVRWHWKDALLYQCNNTILSTSNITTSYCIQHLRSTILLFHHHTYTANVYNVCLARYNVLVLITPQVHSSIKSQFPKVRQTKYTTGDSCYGGISVLNHYLSWSKFVNTHLSHSRQWFNIHLAQGTGIYSCFKQGSHSHGYKKFQDIPGPHEHFPGPCGEPAMFKYSNKQQIGVWGSSV